MCGLIDKYQKSVLRYFGSFENFRRESKDAWWSIFNNISEMTTEQLHEIKKDCVTQMLVPSYMSRKMWKQLHYKADEELSKRV